MYLDDQGHVQWAGLHEYTDLKETRAFVETYGDAVPVKEPMNQWLAAREAYEKQCQRGEVKVRITANGVPQSWETVEPEYAEEAKQNLCVESSEAFSGSTTGRSNALRAQETMQG